MLKLSEILAPACEGVTLHDGDDKCLLEEQVRAYIKWVIGGYKRMPNGLVNLNSTSNKLIAEQIKRLEQR